MIGTADAVTVITVTRGRPDFLCRAMRSVRDQDCENSIRHVIVVDDDEAAYLPVADRAAVDTATPDRSVEWYFERRGTADVPGPPLLARLRNRAVALAATPLVAFIDDDNVFDRNHVSSLVRCMQKTGCPAVHSQMRLVRRDGSPYLEKVSPWKREITAAVARYTELRRHCVYVPWSNVVRDQAHPRDMPGQVQSVDTSEWLFTRELIRTIPFPEVFTDEDWLNMTGEDNKLLAALVAADIPIASTHMPTLNYTLGGYSNDFRHDIVEGEWLAR